MILLMDIHGKDEKAGLTVDQIKALKRLADSYNLAAIEATGLLGGGKS